MLVLHRRQVLNQVVFHNLLSNQVAFHHNLLNNRVVFLLNHPIKVVFLPRLHSKEVSLPSNLYSKLVFLNSNLAFLLKMLAFHRPSKVSLLSFRSNSQDSHRLREVSLPCLRVDHPSRSTPLNRCPLGTLPSPLHKVTPREHSQAIPKVRGATISSSSRIRSTQACSTPTPDPSLPRRRSWTLIICPVGSK